MPDEDGVSGKFRCKFHYKLQRSIGWRRWGGGGLLPPINWSPELGIFVISFFVFPPSLLRASFPQTSALADAFEWSQTFSKTGHGAKHMKPLLNKYVA